MNEDYFSDYEEDDYETNFNKRNYHRQNYFDDTDYEADSIWAITDGMCDDFDDGVDYYSAREYMGLD